MSAIISLDGRYRYRLSRHGLSLPGVDRTAAVVMLNPSTADAETDDATIRKLKGFCAIWNRGHLDVVNIYAYRATDPKQLAHVEAPGPEGVNNSTWVYRAAQAADMLVLAWGNRGKGDRARRIYRMVQCFSPVRIGPLTKAGEPPHPLYLPYDTPLEPMEGYSP